MPVVAEVVPESARENGLVAKQSWAIRMDHTVRKTASMAAEPLDAVGQAVAGIAAAKAHLVLHTLRRWSSGGATEEDADPCESLFTGK